MGAVACWTTASAQVDASLECFPSPSLPCPWLLQLAYDKLPCAVQQIFRSSMHERSVLLPDTTFYTCLDPPADLSPEVVYELDIYKTCMAVRKAGVNLRQVLTSWTQLQTPTTTNFHHKRPFCTSKTPGRLHDLSVHHGNTYTHAHVLPHGKLHVLHRRP